MRELFQDTADVEKQDSYGGICLSMKRYCENEYRCFHAPATTLS